MDKRKCVWRISYAFICILLICNILCVSKCSRVYSVYNENYRDTIYIEREGVKVVHMNGLPSGIVQTGGWTQDGNRNYIIIRRFEDSSLDTIIIGYDDYKYIERGDTIIGNLPLIHDTIATHDTIIKHIENENKNAKAYVLKGAASGIVVEGHCKTVNNDPKNVVEHSCILTVRSLSNSKLTDIQVGRYDYERINLGDTIYGI